jgi:hypothetical protein
LVKQSIETICTLGKTHHEEWFNQFGQCTWWTFFKIETFESMKNQLIRQFNSIT